ncbi:TetR/AcrR family transcriptional regulator [Larkinella insperata]|uniref:TetR/AcrR family transcriptional regulator n=1 Tax=Larkinella insperata TaxID=332158 RepID=A0ABW3QJB9_9BACT|nr:TetR/AcrR family transcriptional regulator [Larkinella insperata]
MDKPEKILATALRLFVTNGFHGTPTSKIASEAGVSNGTLFHYFKTKDELVVALYTTIKGELNQFLESQINTASTSKEKFRRFFVGSVEWALNNGDAFYFIQQFRFSPHLNLVSEEETRQQSEMHTQLLQEAQSLNGLKPLPVDLIATLTASQINGVHQYLVEKAVGPDEQRKLIDDVFELTWATVANPEIR